jgi:hypothetical protein
MVAVISSAWSTSILLSLYTTFPTGAAVARVAIEGCSVVMLERLVDSGDCTGVGARFLVAGFFVFSIALAGDTDVRSFVGLVALPPVPLLLLFAAALLAFEAFLEDALVDNFEPADFAIVLLLVCLLRLRTVVDAGCRGKISRCNWYSFPYLVPSK